MENLEKKGASQTMWIVIVIVIALVVAVILITVFSKTTNNVEDTTDPTVGTSGGVLSTTTCRMLCESCKLTSDAGTCFADKGTGCSITCP